MLDLTGTRVVVTGGASGIGLGLASVLAERGAASVVLADVEGGLAAQVANDLAASSGIEVHGVGCDVTDPASMEDLRSSATELLGGVDFVCLNAGVFAGGHVWETTDDDWDWVLGVNLRGVVNGIRAFVPQLIGTASPAHVMITASMAGIVAAPASGVYCTSKFAAVGLAESLHHDLVLSEAEHVTASVLCPGMVRTNIGKGDRNRPTELTNATVTDAAALAAAGIDDTMGRGMEPVDGARHAIDQLLEGRFYLTTQAVEFWDRLVANENEDRLAGRAPRFQMYE